ncbi:MAG: Fe-S-containing hydro-lyase [candidate division WOR-3 bacterium]
MEIKRITTPLTDEVLKDLKAGDQVLINGIIYSARDLAHKRLVEAIGKKERLPFELKGAVIYYVGPAPAKPGYPIGPAGPTTSGRMDPYTPILLANGLKGMIGKGNRNEEVKKAMMKYKGVYFGAVGGVAALTMKKIKQAKIIAYEDLGPEAISELLVEDFPVIVINDIYGNDLYELGVKKYAKT